MRNTLLRTVLFIKKKIATFFEYQDNVCQKEDDEEESEEAAEEDDEDADTEYEAE